jgi:hypothetical protein
LTLLVIPGLRGILAIAGRDEPSIPGVIGQPFARRAKSLLVVELADVLKEFHSASAADTGAEVVIPRCGE